MHFADDMLYWECLGRNTSEMGETSDKTFYDLDKAKMMRQGADGPTELVDFKLSRTTYRDSEATRNWRDIVAAYSAGKLTVPSDKLPALQGMAKHVYNERKCAYYAGLWDYSLIYDLLWERRGELRPAQQEYLAPSWSWASSGGRVWWRERYRTQEAVVLSANTEPAGQDPMAEVIGGTLKMTGLCLPGIVEHLASNLDDSGTIILKDSTPPEVLSWYNDHASDDRQGENVTLFMMAQMEQSTDYLVLEPVDETKPGVYRRIGIAHDVAQRYAGHEPKGRYRLFKHTEEEDYWPFEKRTKYKEWQEVTII